MEQICDLLTKQSPSQSLTPELLVYIRVFLVCLITSLIKIPQQSWKH